MKTTGLKGRIARKLARAVAVAAVAVAPGVAALTGSLLFVGDAQATEILSESFESNATLANWTNGYGTYATGDNFSNSPHSGVTGGLTTYGNLIGVPGVLTEQTIGDLSAVLTGPEQTAVANGTASLTFDGWLAGWTGDADFATFQAEFFAGTNGTGGSLGVTTLADGSDPTAAAGVISYVDANGTLNGGDAGANTDNWKNYVNTTFVPAGTSSVVVSYIGGGGNGNDAYSDELSVSITDTPFVPDTLEFFIDRSTTGTGNGDITVVNNTGSSVTILGYSITSAGGELDPTVGSWDPISGSAIDPTSTFTILTDRNASTATNQDLSEFQFAGSGLAISNGQTINLGDAWIKMVGNSDTELVYTLNDANGTQVTVEPRFIDGAFPVGDFDFDRDVDVNDWVTLVTNSGVDLSGLSVVESYRQGDIDGDLVNDFDDFSLFKASFQALNPGTSFDAMVASVPEPTSLVLVLMSGLLLIGGRRRAC